MYTFHPESETPLTGHEQHFADGAMDALDAALGGGGIGRATHDWNRLHADISAHLEEAIVNKLEG